MRHVRKYRRKVSRSGVNDESREQKGLSETNQASIQSNRARNVVDALYTHFQKWHPKVLEVEKSAVQ